MTINWEERVNYIGGSEVYKLFSDTKKYEELLKLKTDKEYREKKHSEFPEFFRVWGHAREQVMLDRLIEVYPHLFSSPLWHNSEDKGFWYDYDKYPYIRSTPDALSENYLIECKTKMLHKKTDKWKYTEVPFKYIVQTLYNMFNCHKEYGCLCVEYYYKRGDTCIIEDYEEVFFEKKDIEKYDFVTKCSQFFKEVENVRAKIL